MIEVLIENVSAQTKTIDFGDLVFVYEDERKVSCYLAVAIDEVPEQTQKHFSFLDRGKNGALVRLNQEGGNVDPAFNKGLGFAEKTLEGRKNGGAIRDYKVIPKKDFQMTIRAKVYEPLGWIEDISTFL